jgi:L-histidine Nalpha-methyltransferase / hercynylcysteine S-oxide synthase
MQTPLGCVTVRVLANSQKATIFRNLRKVNLLLQALEKAQKQIQYYALDLSREELERTLAQLPDYEHVSCHGLLGTYDDGREWLKHPGNLARRKCILSLGSSIGMLSADDCERCPRRKC